MRVPQRTVLLLLDPQGSSLLKKRLNKAQYRVLETYTTDHAVAVCVNNPVHAAILDQELFVETGGWSVAQSLKAVQANLCVLLVTEAKPLTKKLPKGVDAIVTGRNSNELLMALDRLLG